MAESIVKFVLGKLADETVKQLLYLCGVEKQMKSVSDELGWIQAFLKDADRTNNSGDERQRHWVKEMREVAYDIEDAIDKACLLGIEVEEDDSKDKSCLLSMMEACLLCFGIGERHNMMVAAKRMFRSPEKIPALNELGVEVDEILDRIKKIAENRGKYATNNLGEGSGGQSESPVRPILVPDFDDPDVVGFEQDRNNIIKELVDGNIKRRCVVSIVGPGGLGKTTLARKVYNSPDVKTTFNLRILITVSQKFQLVDILRKLIEEVRGKPIHANEQGQQPEYFHRELYKSLLLKKYLVVLDDVWENNNPWVQIKEAFPDTKNGSRVLMTTRFVDVAKNADLAREPYTLSYLTEESSLALLLKKALPNDDPDKGYPSNLLDLAKEFIKKCGGLPLALVVLGGLLSKRPPNEHAWMKVMQKMNWRADANEVLASSYDDLPFALKSCFMYFALFPEDHRINVEDLIRMWVAEGFIPHSDKNEKKLEDTGEDFLEDLVQRSMVQVYRRASNGSITHCYVHDMLHDIAIRKAEEDNFLRVSSNPDDQKSCIGARRVAFHHGECNELMKDASSNLRSLFCFKQVPDISRHRQLKILSHKQKLLPGKSNRSCTYEVLPSLRYLQLSSAHYSIHFVGSKNMSFLQTIDVRLAWSVELPESIWHIKTLRHVLLPQRNILVLKGQVNNPGPPPSVHMRNLQTLIGATTRLSWKDEGLPNLPCLRKLDLEVKDGFPLEVLVTFIGTLTHLESLTITSSRSKQENAIRNALKNVKFELEICSIASAAISDFALYII